MEATVCRRSEPASMSLAGCDRTRFEEGIDLAATKMKPVVSICVPNLNTRPFLRERFETIFGQTFQDWEMLVSDNYSDDGAWEFFEELAGNDRRISIAQAPREGLYQNWNNCLRRARGKYVYIATSDDTMSADCLEKLVAALEEHQLIVIWRNCPLDHHRRRPAHRSSGRTGPHGIVFAGSSGELLHRPHVRRAPYDGLLHLMECLFAFLLPNCSIRRPVFDRIGLFTSEWGSVGTEWQMK